MWFINWFSSDCIFIWLCPALFLSEISSYVLSRAYIILDFNPIKASKYPSLMPGLYSLSMSWLYISRVKIILWWKSTIWRIFALFSPISSMQLLNDLFIFFSMSSIILSGLNSSSSSFPFYYTPSCKIIYSSRWVFTIVILLLLFRTTPFTPWRHFLTAWSKTYLSSFESEYKAISSSWLKAPNLENFCFFF